MTLPVPGMVIERPRTALVITDLQNDFLSPGGAAWGLVKDSMAANNTIENLEALLGAARDGGYPVILSPHYYYPADGRWVAAGGALEVLMGQLGVFARKGPLTLDEFDGSGADWPDRFKPYLRACDTVVASPHKVLGPRRTTSSSELRKRHREGDPRRPGGQPVRSRPTSGTSWSTGSRWRWWGRDRRRDERRGRRLPGGGVSWFLAYSVDQGSRGAHAGGRLGRRLLHAPAAAQSDQPAENLRVPDRRVYIRQPGGRQRQPHP